MAGIQPTMKGSVQTKMQASPAGRMEAQVANQMRQHVLANREYKVMERVPSVMELSERNRFGSPARQAATADNNFCYAYYNVGDGVFYPGLSYETNNGETGWYYTGYFMNTQAYHFSVEGVLGSSWFMTNSQQTDLNEYKDENNVLKMPYGIGSWYGPGIKSKRQTYWYGGEYASGIFTQYPNGFSNAGFSTGDSEVTSLAVYDPLECTSYVGFGLGQYAFGTVSPYGESHATLVDLGNVGGGLVVDHLQFRVLSATGCPMGDGGKVTVDMIDKWGEGDEDFSIYTAELTPEDFVQDGDPNSFGSFYCVNVYFTEVDEDGFESEVTPVLNGEVQILIQDNGVNCDFGFFMNCDERENESSPWQNSEGKTYYDPLTKCRTYFYYPEQDGFYALDVYGANATVAIMGSYNFLGEFGTGSRVLTGYVPEDAEWLTAQDGTKYTWAVSNVIDGEVYEDFDIESSFDLESLSIEYDGTEVLGYDLSEDYYAEQKVYPFYFAISELPAGVEGRQIHITLSSNDEVSCEIVINQGVVNSEEGIEYVQQDAERHDATLYNLQGVKASNAAQHGVFVQGGRKFVK